MVYSGKRLTAVYRVIAKGKYKAQRTKSQRQKAKEREREKKNELNFISQYHKHTLLAFLRETNANSR